MLKIFLSYAHADGTDAARRLRELLEASRYEVWRDAEDLRLGAAWRDRLNGELKKVDVILVLLTPESVKPESYVTLEWNVARVLGKEVVAVHVADCDIPDGLKESHICDMRGEKFADGSGRLLTHLGELVEEMLGKLQEEFARLEKDAGYAELRPALEKLKNWASARSARPADTTRRAAFRPELLRTALWLVKRIREDMREGETVASLMDKVISGEYVQPDWEVDEVFQKYRENIQGMFSSLNEEVRKGPAAAPVSVVLLTMNAAEAEALRSEKAFRGHPKKLLQDFRRLRKLLEARGAADWAGRYRDTPEAWQPFSSAEGGENISQLVTRSLNDVEGYEPGTFVPSFKDVRTLTSGNRRLLRLLRLEGCVVIMDLVSMHHPEIQHHFQRSALDYYPLTSVVTVAPFLSAFDVMQEMTVVLQLRVSEMEFTMRRSDRGHDADTNACRQIHEEGVLVAWLSQRVGGLYSSRLSSKKTPAGRASS
jgi:TIR domain